MEAQEAGQPSPLPQRVLKNVAEFPTFDEDGTRGHAAWNAWPWKLHRLEKDSAVTIELYNLAEDPLEQHDVSAQESERTEMMLQQLEAWQQSVLASWAGGDYERRELSP